MSTFENTFRSDLYRAARRARSQPTYQQWELWNLLRKIKGAYPLGAPFYREFVWEGKSRADPPYRFDFYCPRFRLAVELDGPWHRTADGEAHDRKQMAAMALKGINLLRFPASESPANIKRILSDWIARNMGIPRTAQLCQKAWEPPPRKSVGRVTCYIHPESGLTEWGTCWGCYHDKYAASGV